MTRPEVTQIIRVAAGVVVSDGKLLITLRRRGDHLGGYWEFPGGKCLPGESPQACVMREIVEELGIRVTPVRLLEEITHRYPDRLVHLYFYECRLKNGSSPPRPTDRVLWVHPDELLNYPFPPANETMIQQLAARQE